MLTCPGSRFGWTVSQSLLVLTVCFQPSSLSKIFSYGISFRPMTLAIPRIAGPARYKFIPNTLPELEFALQHLFQVAASLVLINTLPGAMPSSKTPPLHPQEDVQPSELRLIYFSHQPSSLCLGCGEPGRPRWRLPQRGQRALILPGQEQQDQKCSLHNHATHWSPLLPVTSRYISASLNSLQGPRP